MKPCMFRPVRNVNSELPQRATVTIMASAFAARKWTDDRAVLSSPLPLKPTGSIQRQAKQLVPFAPCPDLCPWLQKTIVRLSYLTLQLLFASNPRPQRLLIGLILRPHTTKSSVFVSPKAATFSTEERSLRRENGFFFLFPPTAYSFDAFCLGKKLLPAPVTLTNYFTLFSFLFLRK